MWTAQTPLQDRLIATLSEVGYISVQDFSEAELMAEGETLVTSPLLGDVVEMFFKVWQDLDDPVSVTRTICFGLKRNQWRDALIHAIDAIAESGCEDLGPYAKALDGRTGDDDSSLAIRIEAVAGLTRFALRAPQYGPLAISGVMRLVDVEDDWVKAKLCRIVSVLHDHLNWTHAVDSLVTLSQSLACGVEARQELGFVEMANAFRSEDFASMSACLAKSALWFDESAKFAEEAPRARMYGTVAAALAHALRFSEDQLAPDLTALHDAAQWVVVYNPPRAGAAWLHPPPEAELEWVPLLSTLNGAQTQDPFSFLAGAIQLFEKVRAVRVPGNGTTEYRSPSGFSTAAQQGRLVGMMKTWLQGSASSILSTQGRSLIESRLASLGAPPGKH